MTDEFRFGFTERFVLLVFLIVQWATTVLVLAIGIYQHSQTGDAFYHQLDMIFALGLLMIGLGLAAPPLLRAAPGLYDDIRGRVGDSR